uniref:DNA primase large subunit n=1 Tax=Ditylenchus dipsaci TaxID=166011 RepID=A0A915DK93_9BILA
MEFASPINARVRRSIIQGTRRYLKVDEQVNQNNHNLNLYLQPSMETITLLEFQELGQKRIRVLRKIEAIKEKVGSARDEYKKEYLKEVGALMPLATLVCPQDQLAEARRQDRISHFILRLAFCQNMEQSEWFTKLETELFRMRFQLEPVPSIMQFLRLNSISLEQLDPAERKLLAEDLSESHSIPVEQVLKTEFFKVSFDEVFELLFSYRVYLKDGIAYITANELLALIAPRFRENLCSSLARARRHLGFCRKRIDANLDDVTPEMVDELARISFPLCMRNINTQLKIDHKVRYFARRQYGLFLKGIGMSMESSLAFFRKEFTQVMDGDKFSKEYAYNIRHMYGKEGHRVDARPMSCATIILGNTPAPQDCHGCPYRHMETSGLARKLEVLGLSQEQTKKITDLTKVSQYDKACARYFEFTHKMPEGGLGAVITHPNEYYSLSRKILLGERSLDSGLASQQHVFEPQKPTQKKMQDQEPDIEDDFYNDDAQMEL